MCLKPAAMYSARSDLSPVELVLAGIGAISGVWARTGEGRRSADAFLKEQGDDVANVSTADLDLLVERR